MAFGDDFDGSVNHFDGGLIVDCVRRTSETGRPSIRVGHSIFRHHLIVQMREDREVDDSQRAVAAGGRLPPDEVLSDAWGHHHAPTAQPYPNRVTQRWQ
jgi:hypothetical protein